jgi:hypothetical protein
MASQLELDYEFAKKLQDELNGISVTLHQFQQNFTHLGVKFPTTSDSIVVLSDSDDETEDSNRRQRSRSPVTKSVGQVSFENQQAITVSQRIFFISSFYY